MEKPKKNVRFSIAMATSVFLALITLSGAKLLIQGLLQSFGLNTYLNSNSLAVMGTGAAVVLLAVGGLYYINTRWRAV